MARQKVDKVEVAAHNTGLSEIVTRHQMSIILGISTRTLRDLVQRGIVVLGDSPRDVRAHETIQAYLAHLREQAAGRSGNSSQNLADVRAEREIVDRQISEIKLANLRGESLSSSEVQASWEAFATSVRAKFLGLPGKARAQMSHLTAHDGEALRKLVRTELEDLADEVQASVIGADPKVLTRAK